MAAAWKNKQRRTNISWDLYVEVCLHCLNDLIGGKEMHFTGQISVLLSSHLSHFQDSLKHLRSGGILHKHAVNDPTAGQTSVTVKHKLADWSLS